MRTTSGDWCAENDPCPIGWRLPTQDELQSLVDAGCTPITYNGINGRLFGTAPNQLFLPAARARGSDGMLCPFGGGGAYWSSSGFGAHGGWFLSISASWHLNSPRSTVNFNNSNNWKGFSVRCVAE